MYKAKVNKKNNDSETFCIREAECLLETFKKEWKVITMEDMNTKGRDESVDEEVGKWEAPV